MPAAKKTTRKRAAKKATKKQKSFEETLWDTANKLRLLESGQDKWKWGDHLRQVKRARRVRPRRKRPNQFTATTYKLAKMNLAVRGLSANLGNVAADTFFKDQHPDLKADYIMANPPFNLKDWRAADELTNDSRWNGYETPPTGNANYAWILHMVSKLSDWSGATKRTRQGCPEGERGGANQNGFPLLHSPLSLLTSPAKGEGEIRQKMIENDLVDCVENQAYPLAA